MQVSYIFKICVSFIFVISGNRSTSPTTFAEFCSLLPWDVSNSLVVFPDSSLFTNIKAPEIDPWDIFNIKVTSADRCAHISFAGRSL